MATIEAARAAGQIIKSSGPCDRRPPQCRPSRWLIRPSALLEPDCQHRDELPREHGIELWQNYNCAAPPGAGADPRAGEHPVRAHLQGRWEEQRLASHIRRNFKIEAPTTFVAFSRPYPDPYPRKFVTSQKWLG